MPRLDRHILDRIKLRKLGFSKKSTSRFSDFQHPIKICEAGLCTQCELAPSSERVERRVNACFRLRIIIRHHSINSRRSGGDPCRSAPKVQGICQLLHTSTNIRKRFQDAAHMSKVILRSSKRISLTALCTNSCLQPLM